MDAEAHILVLNCGSSSVKFAVFSTNRVMRRLSSGAIERVGLPDGRFAMKRADGTLLFEERAEVPDHEAALDLLLRRLDGSTSDNALRAVGHRVVHGGADCDCPALVTPALEKQLKTLVPLAPSHQPHNLAGISAVRTRRPDIPQIACFDTAFHHRLPRLARITTLPRDLESQGIRRYGFHGLSYEYILANLKEHDGEKAATERLVVAHLGNGASMAAIHDGQSIETTMGFSSLGGLMMGTRPGDLDPGILLHLRAALGMSEEATKRLLYQRSGLLGVSGISRNMRSLLEQQDRPEAAEAVDLFCYRAAQHLASLTAPLGGLDRVVFTGGIGANAPEVRLKICSSLRHLGIEIDPERNRRRARVISSNASAVTVLAVPTDEELVIARHTLVLAPNSQETAYA